MEFVANIFGIFAVSCFCVAAICSMMIVIKDTFFEIFPSFNKKLKNFSNEEISNEFYERKGGGRFEDFSTKEIEEIMNEVFKRRKRKV